MVHVRNGRVPIEHSRFNEGFMMHSSTSPLYTIMASLDVSSKMMDGAAGSVSLPPNQSRRRSGSGARWPGSIARYVGMKKPKDWWFGMWQPDTVTDPKTKKKVPFADASTETLRDNPSCWVLHPGEKWHGFRGTSRTITACSTPSKVTVIMPGVNDDGSLGKWGIPAAVVVKFLDTRGIVNEKSGDYIILFLFSMGNHEREMGDTYYRVLRVQTPL